MGRLDQKDTLLFQGIDFGQWSPYLLHKVPKRVEARRSTITITFCVGHRRSQLNVCACSHLQNFSWGSSGVFGSKCNLHYADDLLILTSRWLEDLRIIKLIPYLFEGMSGLETNFSKKCLFKSNGRALGSCGSGDLIVQGRSASCQLFRYPYSQEKTAMARLGRHYCQGETQASGLEDEAYFLRRSSNADEFFAVSYPNILDVYFSFTLMGH